MTRFVRRATIAAALIAAPLFTIAAPADAAVAAPTAVVHSAHDGQTQSWTQQSWRKRPRPAPATPAPTSPATPAPVGSNGAAVPMSADEAQVVALTNAQRVANGCSALRGDDRLAAAARAHSTDMVTQGFFSHTGSNGSDFVAREVAAGYTTGASAENIAWGYRTPQEVVTGWMNSPGHRANILDCGSKAVGVGLAKKPDGTPYWTQDFGRI